MVWRFSLISLIGKVKAILLKSTKAETRQICEKAVGVGWKTKSESLKLCRELFT